MVIDGGGIMYIVLSRLKGQRAWAAYFMTYPSHRKEEAEAQARFMEQRNPCTCIVRWVEIKE